MNLIYEIRSYFILKIHDSSDTIKNQKKLFFSFEKKIILVRKFLLLQKMFFKIKYSSISTISTEHMLAPKDGLAEKGTYE